MQPKVCYVWDYNIDEAQFREMLAGRLTLGRLNRDWAVLRLLDHGPYEDIVALLGFAALVAGWPGWRARMRSERRRRGLDFLVTWLQQQHPEWLD